MAFQALKDSCEIKFRPIKPFDDLKVGTYSVDSFSMKNTRYGKRIFVNIEDFCVVLPPRFMERINKPQQIDNLNAEHYNMIYRGKDKNQKDLLLLSFVEAVDDTNDNATVDGERASTSTHARSVDAVDGASTSAKALSERTDEPPKKTQRKRTPKKFY